jgi:hypothetical protein
LHHGAENVLLAHQAAVEEGQAGAGHEQDQGGGDQHPGVVAGGLGILDGLLEGRDLSLGDRTLNGRSGSLGQGEGGETDEGEHRKKRKTASAHDISAPKMVSTHGARREAMRVRRPDMRLRAHNSVDGLARGQNGSYRSDDSEG